MTKKDVRRQSRLEVVSIDLIDEPMLAMRQGINPKRLSELAQSIKKNGLIQPIVVYKKNDRYEIIAGQRRYLACKQISEQTIPVIIKQVGEKEQEMIKLEENEQREDVNIVEKSLYLNDIMQKHKLSQKDIARLTGKSAGWVSEILSVAEMKDDILKALLEEEVSFGVARELNKIEPDWDRQNYLDYAIRGGCSREQAKAWVLQFEADKAQPIQQMQEDREEEAYHEVPLASFVCEGCGDFHPMNQLKVPKLCRDCWKIAQPNLRQLKKESDG